MLFVGIEPEGTFKVDVGFWWCEDVCDVVVGLDDAVLNVLW